MITQTLTQVCRSCGSTDIVNNGTNKCGSQQYHCKTCGMTPKERYRPETKEIILKLLLERVFKVFRGTILRWLRRRMKQLPRLSETLLPAQAEDILELDETWSFVGEGEDERWYNTLRQRLGRYTRETLSFSKSDHYHRLVTHAFIVHYNLTIQQASFILQP